MPRPLSPAVALAALALLAGCSGTAPADGPDQATNAPAQQQSERVVVGLTYTPDIQFAPFYLAEARGYYEDTGVEVVLRHHGQSESLFGALEAGEEDLVVAGGDEMLQARSQGVPVTGVATLYQAYPVVLIAGADSQITEPADLAGHSVGIPGPFGETYFGLLAMLAGAGLTEDDVDVEHIGYTQQAALAAGHVDAVVGFSNNDAVQFDRAGLDVRAIDLVAGDVPLVGIGIGASDDVLGDDDARAVVAATLRGVRETIADPQAALTAAADHVPSLTGPDQREAALATLEATVALYGDPDGIGAVDVEQWQRMADFMAEHDLLAGAVDVEQAVTTGLLPTG